MNPPICLFAAYSTDGTIPPHTAHYLVELRKCGFEIHLALSGSQQLTEITSDFCIEHSITAWPRINRGLDFGAWSYLIQRVPVQTASRIFFINDSVFGPFSSLIPIIQRMNARNADVWGMVETPGVVRHLQSWFLCLSQTAFQAPAVQRVFSQDFLNMTKDEIIWHGELGLATAIDVEKLTVDAVWTDRPRLLRRFFPTNPLHSHWRRMVSKSGIPFIKTELLRDNPFRLPRLQDWQRVIPAEGGFHGEWIKAYLDSHPPRTTATAPNLKGRLLYRLINQAERVK